MALAGFPNLVGRVTIANSVRSYAKTSPVIVAVLLVLSWDRLPYEKQDVLILFARRG